MPPPARYSVWWRDENDNAVIYPQFLRKAEKQLKRTQRRLSKKFVKGAKPQSNNYHKARKRLGRVHLKIQRQRKDWAIKQARNVVISNDVMVYKKCDSFARNLLRGMSGVCLGNPTGLSSHFNPQQMITV
jgi:transposase